MHTVHETGDVGATCCKVPELVFRHIVHGPEALDAAKRWPVLVNHAQVRCPVKIQAPAVLASHSDVGIALFVCQPREVSLLRREVAARTALRHARPRWRKHRAQFLPAPPPLQLRGLFRGHLGACWATAQVHAEFGQGRGQLRREHSTLQLAAQVLRPNGADRKLSGFWKERDTRQDYQQREAASSPSHCEIWLVRDLQVGSGGRCTNWLCAGAGI